MLNPQRSPVESPIFRTLMALCLLGGVACAQGKKAPVPTIAAQHRAVQELRRAYRGDYTKNEPARLAEKLIAAATEATDLATSFVLLKEARGLCVNAGDLAGALAAIDRLGQRFKLTAAGKEGTVLGMKVAAMKAVGKRTTTPEARRSLAQVCMKSAEAAMKAGDLAFSIEAGKRAQQWSRNPRLKNVARGLVSMAVWTKGELDSLQAAGKAMSADRDSWFGDGVQAQRRRARLLPEIRALQKRMARLQKEFPEGPIFEAATPIRSRLDVNAAALAATQLRRLKGRSPSSRGVGVIAFSSTADHLAIASKKTLELWKNRASNPFAKFEHPATVVGVDFSPDGHRIATLDADHAVRVWDIAKRKLWATLGHAELTTAFCVVFAPDGQTLATGTRQGAILLFDVSTKKVIGKLEGHAGGVRALVFTPDGTQLVSCSSAWAGKGSVRLWEIATGVKIWGMRPNGPNLGIALSPDGKFLAVAMRSKYEAVKIFKTATGELHSVLSGTSGSAWSVAFSPDGKFLAAGMQNRVCGNLLLWDVARLELVANARSGRDPVYQVAFSRDSKSLCSGEQG